MLVINIKTTETRSGFGERKIVATRVLNSIYPLVTRTRTKHLSAAPGLPYYIVNNRERDYSPRFLSVIIVTSSRCTLSCTVIEIMSLPRFSFYVYDYTVAGV